jgi:hypothetical protein
MRLRFVILLAFFLLASWFMPVESHTAGNGDFLVYLPLVCQPALPTGNAVTNGNFEAGRSGWTEYEDSAFFDFPLIVEAADLPAPIAPYEGSWVAWLGGESELLSYIEQEVRIPEVNPELEYWLWIDSRWPCGGSYGRVLVNGTIVDSFLLCTGTATDTWVARRVDLSAYAGLTVTLRLLSQTTVDDYGSLYLDAVSIHSSP